MQFCIYDKFPKLKDDYVIYDCSLFNDLSDRVVAGFYNSLCIDTPSKTALYRTNAQQTVNHIMNRLRLQRGRPFFPVALGIFSDSISGEATINDGAQVTFSSVGEINLVRDIMYFVISLSRLFQLDIRTILKQQNTYFGTYPIPQIITDLRDMVDSLISNLCLIADLHDM